MQSVEIMVQEAGSRAASRELGLIVHEMDGAVSARLLRSIARFARSPSLGQEESRQQLPLPAAPLRAAAVVRTLRGRGRR